MNKFLQKLKNWKPIHLCWWFRKHGWKIPKYLIGNSLSTVGTTTTQYAFQLPITRMTFHANGRFWVFYFSDNTTLAYCTSTDGSIWSEPTTARAGAERLGKSLWFDGTYFHYSLTIDDILYYRRGTPNADGSITWSADEQTVSTEGDSPVTLCVDSNGYPWIGYAAYDAHYIAKIIKSSTNDGTWSTASGFPYTLRDSLAYPLVIPLTEGKVYVICRTHVEQVYGRLWDGESWGDEETISSSDAYVGYYQSAVAEGDDVHLVFLKDVDYHILYVKRTYGVGWGEEATVQSSVTSDSTPVLSIDGDGTLYCFWMGSPTAHHVYYKECVAGTWDAEPTDWIDESSDNLTDNYWLSCYYGAYEGYTALSYLTKTESPFDIKHKYLSGLTEFTPVTDYISVTACIDTDLAQTTFSLSSSSSSYSSSSSSSLSSSSRSSLSSRSSSSSYSSSSSSSLSSSSSSSLSSSSSSSLSSSSSSSLSSSSSSSLSSSSSSSLSSSSSSSSSSYSSSSSSLSLSSSSSSSSLSSSSSSSSLSSSSSSFSSSSSSSSLSSSSSSSSQSSSSRSSSSGAVGINMKVNIGDSWKEVTEIKVNIGDTWKNVISIKQNIGNTWKDVF